MRTSAFAVLVIAFVVATPLVAKKRLSDPPPVDPCTILTPDVVKTHFPKASPTGGAGKYAKNMCQYKWSKPNAAEVERRNQAKMKASMDARMAAMRAGKRYQPKPGEMAPESLENEVWVSVPHFKMANDEQAARNFNDAVTRLNEGITRTVRGKTFTFQSKTEPVKGVGDRAEWVDKQRELGVLDGDRFFWVGVKVHGEAAKDRAEAIALAKRLLSGDARAAMPTPIADDK
jgi:hypothetical protein